MITSRRVTVGTTATRVDTTPESSGSKRQIVVRNLDAAVTIDLGGPAVTSGAGFSLLAGESVSLDLNDLDGVDGLYGIVASGSASVAVLYVVS